MFGASDLAPFLSWIDFFVRFGVPVPLVSLSFMILTFFMRDLVFLL